MSNKVVISLFEGRKGDLWIGTDGGGLNRFEPRTEHFTHYPQTFGDKIVSITDFSNTELLVSLYGEGVFRFDTHTLRYTPFTIVDWKTNREECFAGFVPFCYRIAPDRILILSNHTYIYHTDSRRFEQLDYADGAIVHSPRMLCHDDRCTFLAKGNILYVLDNRSGHIEKSATLAGNESVNSGCYNPAQERLWIGSSGGLKYYDFKTGKTGAVATNMFSHITAMCQDTENRLWINAGNLLFSYDEQDGTFRVWGDSDGFLSNDILTLYVEPFSAQYIYMGGSNGLVKIDRDIRYDDNVPAVFSLQSIDLNGQLHRGTALAGAGAFRVPQNYGSLKIHIDLNEKDLFRRVLFRYRISGPSGNSTVESYSNVLDLTSLAAGQYSIFVACMTRSGGWTDETNLVSLRVIPPWYQRTWFAAAVICFAAGIIVLSIFFILRRNRRKMEWEMARRRQELNTDKIQFLTNVSHELRTPLTLIYAPLKRMLEHDIDRVNRTEEYRQLENIYHQASHMKEIINWVLDYDRATDLSDALHPVPTDLNELLRQTVSDFAQEFETHGIGLRFQTDETLQPIAIDAAKIRIVISNLLMNALKFSESGRHITIGSRLREDFVRVWVADEGIGLQNVDTERLFTRFYRENQIL